HQNQINVHLHRLTVIQLQAGIISSTAGIGWLLSFSRLSRLWSFRPRLDVNVYVILGDGFYGETGGKRQRDHASDCERPERNVTTSHRGMGCTIPAAFRAGHMEPHFVPMLPQRL